MEWIEIEIDRRLAAHRVIVLPQALHHHLVILQGINPLHPHPHLVHHQMAPLQLVGNTLQKVKVFLPLTIIILY